MPFATLVTLLPPISTVFPPEMLKLPKVVLPFTVKSPVAVTLLNSTSSLVEILSVLPSPSILMFLPALMLSVSPALIFDASVVL